MTGEIRTRLKALQVVLENARKLLEAARRDAWDEELDASGLCIDSEYEYLSDCLEDIEDASWHLDDAFTFAGEPSGGDLS